MGIIDFQTAIIIDPIETKKRNRERESLDGYIFGVENLVYLSSYVLASRSSDVSSQFRRVHPDRAGLETRAERGGARKRTISTSIFAKHYTTTTQRIHVDSLTFPPNTFSPPNRLDRDGFFAIGF